MKKIVYILLLSSFLFAEQSIYPLPFVFDEKNLFATDMTISKYETENAYKSIFLRNSEDNYFTISDTFFAFPPSICKPIQSIEDLQYYQVGTQQINMCQNLFNKLKTKPKKLNINDFEVFIYFENSHSTAFIFYKNHFTALVSSNMKSSEFMRILWSIQRNKHYNNYDINYYIDKTKYYINKGKINIATRYLFSAFLIDSSNDRLLQLQKELQDLKSNKIIYIYEAKEKK